MINLIRTIFVLFLVGLVVGLGAVFWRLEHKRPVWSYNEFVSALENDEVAEVELRGHQLKVVDVYKREFSTFAPDVEQLVPQLLSRKVRVYGTEPGYYAFVWNIAGFSIPLLVVILAWYSLLRRQQKSDGDTSFGRDRAITPQTGGKPVTFRDVAGIPEAKAELLEVVDFLQNPKKYNRIGAVIPRGILFQGPPGTGKTLMARAVAGEAGVPFFSISGSDFVEMFVGVGASRVRELFHEAKKSKPCIVFIDEIDAVGARRSGPGAAGGQEERGQTLNALLVEMDGFSSDDNVIVIAATNRPDILDPALLRPGRFDRTVNILPPDVKGRLKILEVHIRKIRVSPELDLDEIARSTPGFTGAEIASLVNEAALIAGRTGKEYVTQIDFEVAKDRILMGVERKGLVISDEDRWTMACHEAGHAIVAKKLPDSDPLHKITIIPRGRAMGHTQQLPLQDRHAFSRQYLKGRICILLGGRVAEELMIGEISTGAEEDLQQAIEIATSMVARWGMNEVVGPLAFIRSDGGFLGGETGWRHHSEDTARTLDREIRALIDECYSRARELLEENRYFLKRLSQILIDAETIDREELEIVNQCVLKRIEDGTAD